jgi:hypothetical protein
MDLIDPAVAAVCLRLWKRVRAELACWNPVPAYACAYGPAVAGRVSILLVRPELLTGDEACQWSRQVGELPGRVRASDGGTVLALEMTGAEWADHCQRRSPAYRQLAVGGIEIATDH